MGRAAFDEIHPNRPWRLLAQQLQLQPALAQLQGELRVIRLQRQAQSRCPVARLLGILRRKGFDTNQRGCGIHTELDGGSGKRSILPEPRPRCLRGSYKCSER